MGRAGLDHQVPLQRFLVHLPVCAVQIHQRPALHGRHVVALQQLSHQLMHLMVAVAEQRPEVLRPLLKAELHGDPPYCFRIISTQNISVLNDITVIL